MGAFNSRRDEPPCPPPDLARQMVRDGRREPGRHRRKRPGFARFFTKQLLLFAACSLLVLAVDIFLYAAIAVSESDAHFSEGTPRSVTRAVNEGLSSDGETLRLDKAAVKTLDDHGAWAMLIDEDGEVAWSQNLPADVPSSFSTNDVAMAAHYSSIGDYPAFFWDRDDGLLVVGYPRGEFWTMSFTYPSSTVAKFPLFLMLIFAVDAAILFALYAVTRRRTQNAMEPVADALDKLSQGQAVTVRLKGDLRELGERITETSDVIEMKDAARASWIRGVSHDIRTPLSMILGYADGIAGNEAAPADVRAQAAVVRAQGLRIKNLVTDLNTASQLEYAAQAARTERVHLPRLLRSVSADCLNADLDGRYPLELDVAPRAADAVVLGDERLLTRAVENAVTNARLHNEEGCSVRISLDVASDGAEGAARTGAVESGGRAEASAAADAAESWAVVRIVDDGKGVDASQLSAIEARLARSRAAGSVIEPAGSGEHGLGLAIVDRIAREHGGTLSLASEPDAGFEVRLALPLA